MTSTTKNPAIYIIAGPNGSGKTTFAFRYLPEAAACRDFLNTDEIAKGLSPLDFSAGLRTAGRIFLNQLEQKLQLRKDFAFETTLSGKNYLARIPRWQAEGWKVILFYLYIPSPEFSAKRVQVRAEQGGHDVPLEDIARRYPRSIENLFQCAKVCNAVVCLDNSRPDPELIFEKPADGTVRVFNASVFPGLQETADPDHPVMTGTAEKARKILRDAVRAELKRKAKLGFRAVICRKNGKGKILSAADILRTPERNP